MTNSFISSLSAIDTSSVTDSSSLFFFGQDNDSPRLVPADALQSFLGKPLGIYVEVASATYTLSGATSASTYLSSRAEFDRAVIDDFGAFNPNSTGIITMPFAGLVVVIAHYYFQANTIGQHAQRMRVFCNSDVVMGGQIATGDYVDPASPPTTLSKGLHTAPFSVTHGDVIWADLSVRDADANVLKNATYGNSPASSARGTWMYVKPLFIDVGSV